MGPAILWTSTFNEAALRPARPTTDGIRPVPDSIEESFIPHKTERFRTGPVALSISTLNQAALRQTGPVTQAVRPVPDSPDLLPYRNRSHAEPSWEFQFASTTGASFAACAPPLYEPGTGCITMLRSAWQLWDKPAERASGSETMLSHAELGPALAPFSKIAHPESMQSTINRELRDRIFNPILPQFPRIRFRQSTMEAAKTTIRESRVFAPVDYRWQRNRRVWARGASWKAPARIGLFPACAPSDWPGPLSVARWGSRRSRVN